MSDKKYGRRKLRELKLRFSDSIKHSAMLRALAGSVCAVWGCFSGNVESRLWRYVRGLEIASPYGIWLPVKQWLRMCRGFDNPEVWASIVRRSGRYEGVLSKDPGLTRSIVLKSPSSREERGVLLMYFEYNLARMLLGLGDLELKKLQQSYHLVFASSWSPTDYALLCLAGAKLTESLFVQVSNHQEEWQVKELHPNLISTGLLPCDWINPEVFTPKKFEERETDIIMVANWGEFKRHWEFFKALGELPDHLSVVLIGQKEGGRDMGYIQRLAQFYGVRQRLSFYESLGINEVSNHLCNAKVALIFSRREGGCVAAVEALFAGCALGMRADAHVGSAAHINRRTGLLLRPGHLGGDLLRLLELAPELEPREWAVESITHEITRARLNETVRNSEISAGRPWTHDLAQIEWRPYASYSRVVDQERFLPDYEFLNEVDPAVFGGLLEQFGGRRSVAVAKAG